MTTPSHSDDVLKNLCDAIDAAHVAAYRNTQRTYLPCSDIGNDCHRDLWMTFRWASPVKPVTGQKVRIFRRGDREEDRIVADYRAAGLQISDKDDTTGKQWTFTLARGHAMVRIDGAMHDPRGILMSSASWALFEAKSHNKEQFATLVRHGLKKSHPRHYAQCQIGMKMAGLDVAIYAARCKDNEEDRPIKIPLDQHAADGCVRKAELIVNSTDAPTRISIDHNYFRCRMCPNQAVCHGLELPLRNCRSCAFSVVQDEGKWSCGKEGMERPLDFAAQTAGCGSHRWIPSLIKGIPELRDKNLEWVQYKLDNGEILTDNGVSR